MPMTVVAIHGVGPGVSAETGRAVARNLSFGVTRQTTVYAGGEALLEFTEEATKNSVIEVYWADLLQPKSTATGLLRHLSYIVTSMLDVAVREINGRFSPIGWLYGLALLTLTPGAVLATLATAAAVSIPGAGHRRLILLTVLIASVFLAVWLWKLGQHFVGILLWGVTTAFVIAVFIAALHEPIDAATHRLVALSGTIRTVGFGSVILLLVLATGECWVRRWQQPRDTKLAYTALLYLPFIVINGLMTWIGVLALSYVSDYPNYRSWEEVMLPSENGMNVRWAVIEGATTVVIGSIGLLALILPGIGYLIGADSSNGNRRGRGARNGVSLLLAVAPISLILLLVFSACIMRGMFPNFVGWFDIPKDIKLLEIYQDSVLRTLPYLMWLIGPFAIALDVIGDILFYLQPNRRHPAAIAEVCKRRLVAAVNYAEGKGSGHKVVVLANSQGSKIAADLRDEREIPFTLVTTGSPVDALYSRFLGVENDVNQARENVRWVNCFCDGDVIAGPIDRHGVDNKPMGRGGHTGYWSDPNIAGIIREQVEQ
jgi:hypothetical protein